MASRKSKPAKNQKPDSDVADRLREIKQMQANWMSQRERHQESGGSGVFDSTSTGRQEENHKKTPNSTTAKKASTKKEPDPYMWIISSGQKKKKSSVRARSASPAARTSTSSSSSGSRTSSRQNSSRNSTHAKPPTPKSTSSVATSAQKKERTSYAESGKRQVYGSEPDLNSVSTDLHGLESDSRKHRTNSIDKGATYNLENSDIRTTSNTASNTQNENISGTREKALSSTGGLMAPDMFDKLADQIASRVKAEIEQEREQEEYSRPRRVMSHDGGENDDVISSHKCSKCKQLMIPPDHTPTLLIPCGHTMCEACAEDRLKCPTCRTKVASLLCNTTLQSVIQDFIAKRKPGYSHHSLVSSSSQRHDSGKKGYSPANYEDRTHKGRQEEDGFQRQTMNNSDQGQHYAEEYQSLVIRSEALKNEKETIVENLEGFASKIERQKKQLGNIEREEEKLQEQITELQERLETLRMHKKDYKEKFSELEDTHQQETQRLSMVKDTLRAIHNSMEKVKMLARNFNVFIEDD